MPNDANILIVEDERDLRQIYKMLLERQGYRVRCAESALDGLAQLEHSKPDLIVSDLRMPGMSGYKFLEIVRRCFPQVPVIVISGAYSGSGIPKRLFADAFFPRAGFTANQLFEQISDLLHSPVERQPKAQTT